MKQKIFAYIMLALVFPMMILLIFSCTPQKRLNKLLTKFPDLVKTDTVFIKDTVITHQYHTDTILSIHHIPGDTITIYDHKLIEKIIYLKGDSFEVQVKVDPDTIIKKEPQIIKQVKGIAYKKTTWKERAAQYIGNDIINLIIWLFVGLALYIIFRVVKKELF